MGMERSVNASIVGILPAELLLWSLSSRTALRNG
jgi:hypothetical protein